MHTRRIILADSPRYAIPYITVPIAPIPVQIVYALPIGRVLSEYDSSIKLINIAEMVIIDGYSRVNPTVYFKPTAHTTSNKPAKNKDIQAIFSLLEVSF